MRVIYVLLSTCVHECMPVRAPTVGYVSACVACVPMSLYLCVRISEFISKAVRVPACLCCVCTCEFSIADTHQFCVCKCISRWMCLLV